MTTNYTVRLADGTTITIEGVTTVEKDGAGLRFKDEDGGVIAGFDDGRAKAHWPAEAVVTPAQEPEAEEEGD